MAEDQPNELPATEQPVPEEEAVVSIKTQGRNRKLMLILGAAVLGGTIAGVGGTIAISSLFKEKPAAIPVSSPAPKPEAKHAETHVPDPKQEALINELKEQNKRLEAQVKQQQATLSNQDTSAKSEATGKAETKPPPPPPRVIYRTVKSNEKPKVAEDCEITDKTEGLDERLKSCIDNFNKSTR